MHQSEHLPCLPRRKPDQHRAYDTGVPNKDYEQIRGIVRAGMQRIAESTKDLARRQLSRGSSDKDMEILARGDDVQTLKGFTYTGTSPVMRANTLQLSTNPGPGVYKAKSFTPPLGREEVFSSSGIDIDCVPRPYESPLSRIDIVLEKFREQGSEALSQFDKEELKVFDDESSLPWRANNDFGRHDIRMLLIQLAIRDLAKERQDECAGKLADGIIERISRGAGLIANQMNVSSAYDMDFTRSDMAEMGIGTELLHGGLYRFEKTGSYGDIVRACWLERVCKLAAASVNEKLKAGLIRVRGTRISVNSDRDPLAEPAPRRDLQDGEVKFALKVNQRPDTETMRFKLTFGIAEQDIVDGWSCNPRVKITNIAVGN